MSGFELRRLGMLMEPERGNLYEIEGVLNPAAARGGDGRTTSCEMISGITVRWEGATARVSKKSR
jgi:hypothetical protein